MNTSANNPKPRQARPSAQIREQGEPVSGSESLPGQPADARARGGTPSPPMSPPPAPGKPRQPSGAHRTTDVGRLLIGLEDAANLLGLSVASVRRLIWRAELPVVRITRRLQVDVRDLERLIEQAKDRIG